MLQKRTCDSGEGGLATLKCWIWWDEHGMGGSCHNSRVKNDMKHVFCSSEIGWSGRKVKFWIQEKTIFSMKYVLEKFSNLEKPELDPCFEHISGVKRHMLTPWPLHIFRVQNCCFLLQRVVDKNIKGLFPVSSWSGSQESTASRR